MGRDLSHLNKTETVQYNWYEEILIKTAPLKFFNTVLFGNFVLSLNAMFGATAKQIREIKRRFVVD